MRDLKADLGMLTGDWGAHESDWFRDNGVAITTHAIERALKAETLNLELIEAIEVIIYYKNRGCKCGYGDSPSLTCEMCDNYHSALKTVEKAKEVLGDE